MRLPTELWVKAYLRHLSSAGAYATVAAHGDDDLGTIWIKINRLDGSAILLSPAPEPLHGDATDRRWIRMHTSESIPEPDAEQQVRRAKSFDSDLWIIEIEDRACRHGLDDALIKN